MRTLRQKIEVLRIISSPIRIQILMELYQGVKCVSDLEDILEAKQPNISQHLSLLRNHGVIDYYVDGNLRCYFLVDAMVPELINILNKEFIETIPAPTCCPAKKNKAVPSMS